MVYFVTQWHIPWTIELVSYYLDVAYVFVRFWMCPFKVGQKQSCSKFFSKYLMKWSYIFFIFWHVPGVPQRFKKWIFQLLQKTCCWVTKFVYQYAWHSQKEISSIRITVTEMFLLHQCQWCLLLIFLFICFLHHFSPSVDFSPLALFVVLFRCFLFIIINGNCFRFLKLLCMFSFFLFMVLVFIIIFYLHEEKICRWIPK